MDDDFCFDVQKMIVLSTVLLGGAGYLAYLLGLAERSDRKGSVVVISIFLGVWVILGSLIFLSYLVDFLPLPEMGLPSLAPLLRRCLRGVAWLQRLPIRCARRHQCATSGGDAAPLPQFMAPGEGLGMAALAGEPPVRGGVAVDGIAVYGEKCGGAAPECSVCLCVVEKEVTAKWLPLCLHLFHRECIDHWLRENSTCPVCRCDVFVELPEVLNMIRIPT